MNQEEEGRKERGLSTRKGEGRKERG